jgi:hypothetical protein
MPETEAEKLVNELKKWATENEKSQSEIARLLRVDRRRVNDWFAGAKMPTLEFGIRIQRLLKGKRQRKWRSECAKGAKLYFSVNGTKDIAQVIVGLSTRANAVERCFDRTNLPDFAETHAAEEERTTPTGKVESAIDWIGVVTADIGAWPHSQLSCRKGSAVSFKSSARAQASKRESKAS